MDNTIKQDFVDYVCSLESLEALEKLSMDMDKDIEESQHLMDELKTVLYPAPGQRTSSSDSGLRHEDLSNYLEAHEPNLLLQDMCDSVMEIDLDDVIANMKSYVEELKQSCSPQATKTEYPKSFDVNNLDLDQYAFSLDQLGKRLANIKLTQKEEVMRRNPELEDKLSQLCEDIDQFAKSVQAKTRIVECNKTLSESQQASSSVSYSEIISKLMSGVNEVIYLLNQKRNLD